MVKQPLNHIQQKVGYSCYRPQSLKRQRKVVQLEMSTINPFDNSCFTLHVLESIKTLAEVSSYFERTEPFRIHLSPWRFFSQEVFFKKHCCSNLYNIRTSNSNNIIIESLLILYSGNYHYFVTESPKTKNYLHAGARGNNFQHLSSKILFCAERCDLD